MSSPGSDSHDNNTRKRVGKACDRCRLKKSKCNGLSPCSRCKADNAICVFGERKKSHDKIYPKGYVEMLEQQQSQLVAGLREMYKMILDKKEWPGKPLSDQTEGHPLTHDILERLHVLHMTGDGHSLHESFEDDLDAIQQRLLENGASYMSQSRRSPSTESDPGLAHSESPVSTPMVSSLSNVPSTHSQQTYSPDTPLVQTETYEISNKAVTLGLQQPCFGNTNIYQEPWAIESSELDMNADFTLYNNTYESNSKQMFNSLDTLLPTLNSVPVMQMDWSNQDPDFTSFMKSGYHGTLS